MQLQQGAGSLETAQLESRAAVEAKDEEAAKRGLVKLYQLLVELKLKVGKPEVWNPDKTLNILTRGSGAHSISNLHYMVTIRCRAGLLAPHQWKWPLVQTKKWLQAA